ncbi:hypothetical protein RSAG8_09065, partial [Rhizoctonia solani AG-8 WAC10335]
SGPRHHNALPRIRQSLIRATCVTPVGFDFENSTAWPVRYGCQHVNIHLHPITLRYYLTCLGGSPNFPWTNHLFPYGDTSVRLAVRALLNPLFFSICPGSRRPTCSSGYCLST